MQLTGFRKLWTVTKGFQGSGFRKKNIGPNWTSNGLVCWVQKLSECNFSSKILKLVTTGTGFREKTKARIEPARGLFAGFRECLNVANNVQGTVNSYFKGSGFTEKKRGLNWASKWPVCRVKRLHECSVPSSRNSEELLKGFGVQGKKAQIEPARGLFPVFKDCLNTV